MTFVVLAHAYFQFPLLDLVLSYIVIYLIKNIDFLFNYNIHVTKNNCTLFRIKISRKIIDSQPSVFFPSIIEITRLKFKIVA